MNSKSIKVALLAMAFGLFQMSANAGSTVKEIAGKKYQQYTVKKGETLFSISKKYNISVADLQKVNPELKNGLKSDAKIYVPVSGSTASASKDEKKAASSTASTKTSSNVVEHKVGAGETLTSIAKKYNTTVDELKKDNAKVLKDGLKSGTTIKVRKGTSTAKADTKASTSAAKTETTSTTASGTCKYKVKKGETLYAICKRQGCTIDEAKKLNPALKKREIEVGETLTLPQPNSSKSSTTTASTAQSGTTAHVVKKGETLYSIASDYKVSTSSIEKLNPGVKKSGVKAGKALIMPSTSRWIAKKNSDANYSVYKAKKGETVFSISKKTGVSQGAIIASNNNVKNGVQAGQLIAIPNKAKQKTGVASAYKSKTATTAKKSNNVAHTVKKGETMFSLCKTYKITESDLVKANPELKSGLKTGKIVFIPRTEEKKYAWSSSYFVTTKGNNEVNVAIMLPFGSGDGSIDNNTDKFLEFYQGALLAVKDLKEKGISVNVHVYNSGKTEGEIQSILAKSEMKQMDFMIGPAYKAQFPAMSAFAIAHDVKMVVPFSSRTEEMKSNPNIFLVNAPKSKTAQETATSLVKEIKDKNVVVVKFKTDSKNDKIETADSIVAHLHKAGTPVHIIDYTSASDMKDLMSSDKDNVIITTSTDQVALTQLLPSINSLQVQKYDVNIFGYSEWTKYQTIAKDLFTCNTYMASPYDINYKSAKVKGFIADFRNYYGQEPGNTTPMYGALGYDIMLYFGKAVALYGKNFESGLSQLSASGLPTLQSDFKFKRYSSDGGYYNSDITISKNNAADGHVALDK